MYRLARSKAMRRADALGSATITDAASSLTTWRPRALQVGRRIRASRRRNLQPCAVSDAGEACRERRGGSRVVSVGRARISRRAEQSRSCMMTARASRRRCGAVKMVQARRRQGYAD